MKQAHGEAMKILPVLAPADIVATATHSQYVDTDQCVGLVEFEVNFGAITSTDSTGQAVVTVESSTSNASTDSGTAIAFQYQLSDAVATDNMGAVTAATSSGVALESSSDDNKTLVIYVDPAVGKVNGDDHRYIGFVVTPTADVGSTVVGGVMHYTPRYAQASQKSST